MALPDAPTITTEEELNKLLAQIQGGMTPPTIKRDAFGNIVVTQNGEATMVPLTFYRTDAFGQLLKQAGEKVDDVSYQQSLVGRLADLTAEVEIQSLKDRGTPEESIDTESIKKKALGQVSKEYVTGGVTPLRVQAPFESFGSVYQPTKEGVAITGVAPPVQYTAETSQVAPPTIFTALGRQQVVPEITAQKSKEQIEVDRPQLLSVIKQDLQNNNVEGDLDKLATQELTAIMTAVQSARVGKPYLSEVDALKLVLEDLAVIDQQPIIDPATLKPESLAPEGGPQDPTVQAFKRQVDLGKPFKQLTPIQAEYRKAQMQQAINDYVDENKTNIAKEQVPVIYVEPAFFYAKGERTPKQQITDPEKMAIPMEIWNAILNNNLLVNPPIVSQQFDENVKRWSSDPSHFISSDNLKMLVMGADTAKPSTQDADTIAKIRAKQVIGNPDSWIYDPTKTQQITANPEQYVESGILSELGPLGGQAETVTGWAMRSMLTLPNVISGGYVHYVNDPIMGTIASAFSDDVYDISKEREQYRKEHQALYGDSPVLANIALNKGVIGEAKEISDQIGLEGWQKTTHLTGSLLGDFIEPSFGIGSGAYGAFKNVKAQKQARAISTAMLAPNQTLAKSQSLWKSAKDGFAYGFYKDSNIITGLSPQTAKKWRTMVDPGDVRALVTNKFADELVAEQTIQDANKFGLDAYASLEKKGLQNTEASKHFTMTGEGRGIPTKEQLVQQLQNNKLLKAEQVAEFEKTYDDWMATKDFLETGTKTVGTDVRLVEKLEQYYGIKVDAPINSFTDLEKIGQIKDAVNTAFARGLVIQVVPELKAMENFRAITKNTFAHESKIPDILKRASESGVAPTLHSIVKRGELVVEPISSTPRTVQFGEKTLVQPLEQMEFYKLDAQEATELQSYVGSIPRTASNTEYLAKIQNDVTTGRLAIDDLRYLIDQNLDSAAATLQRDIISAKDISHLSTKQQQKWMEAGGFRSFNDPIKAGIDFVQTRGKKALGAWTEVVPETAGGTLQQRRLIKDTAQEASTMDNKLRREVSGLMGSAEYRARFVDDPQTPMNSIDALAVSIVGERADTIADVDRTLKGLEERLSDQAKLDKEYDDTMRSMQDTLPGLKQAIRERAVERRAILRKTYTDSVKDLNDALDADQKALRKIREDYQKEVRGKTAEEVKEIKKQTTQKIADYKKASGERIALLEKRAKKQIQQIEADANKFVEKTKQQATDDLKAYEARYKEEQLAIREQLDSELAGIESDWDKTMAKLGGLVEQATIQLEAKTEPRTVLDILDSAIEDIKLGIDDYFTRNQLADLQARSRRGYLGWDTRKTKSHIDELRMDIKNNRTKFLEERKKVAIDTNKKKLQAVKDKFQKDMKATKQLATIEEQRIKAEKEALIQQQKQAVKDTIDALTSRTKSQKDLAKQTFKEESQALTETTKEQIQALEAQAKAPRPVSTVGQSFEDVIQGTTSFRGDSMARVRRVGAWAIDRLFVRVGEKADLNSSLLRAGGDNLTYKSDILTPKGQALLNAKLDAFAIKVYAQPKLLWEHLNTLVGEMGAIVRRPENVIGGNTKSITMLDMAAAEEIRLNFMTGMYYWAEGDRIVARNAIRAVEQDLVKLDVFPEMRFRPEVTDDVIGQHMRSYVGTRLGSASMDMDAWRVSTSQALEELIQDSTVKGKSDIAEYLNKVQEYSEVLMRKNGLDVGSIADINDVNRMLDDVFGATNERIMKGIMGSSYDEMKKALTDARVSGLTQSINSYLRKEATKPGWKTTSKAVTMLLNMVTGAYRYSMLLGARVYFHTGNILTGPSMSYATVGNLSTGVATSTVAYVGQQALVLGKTMIDTIKAGKVPKWQDIKNLYGKNLQQMVQPTGNSLRTMLCDSPSSPYYNMIAIVDRSGKPYTYGEVYELLQSSGIRSEINFVTSAISNDSLINFLKRRTDTTLSSKSKNTLGFLGEFFVQDLTLKEDLIFRTNVFYDSLAKGFSAEEAVQLAKRSMFDYSDMSAAEKTVATNLLMFYSFSRANWAMFSRAFTDLQIFKRYVEQLKFQRGVETFLMAMDEESGNRPIYEKLYAHPMAMEKIAVNLTKGETRDYYMMSPPIPALGAMVQVFGLAEDLVSVVRGEEPTGYKRTLTGFVSPGLKNILEMPNLFEYSGKNVPTEYVNAAAAFTGGDPTATAGVLQYILGGEIYPLQGTAEDGAVNGFLYPISEKQRERIVWGKKVLGVTGLDAPIMEWSKIAFGAGEGKTAYQTTPERVLGLTRPVSIQTGTKFERSLLMTRKRAMESRIKELESQLGKTEEAKKRAEEEE